jgi:class 3 adenylate cyclase
LSEDEVGKVTALSRLAQGGPRRGDRSEHRRRLRRIVKTTGDGILVAFSVVDALRRAAEVEAAMMERNAPLSPDRLATGGGDPSQTCRLWPVSERL